MSALRNWTLSTYTTGQWTTLAKAPAKIRSLVIANTAGESATVSARIANGDTDGRAVILPDTAIDAGGSQVLDLCQLNLGRADTLQFQFSVAGVNVTASGEIED